MKKLFLIPLMTLLTCVMAWGTESFDYKDASVPSVDGMTIEASAPAKIRKASLENEEPVMVARIENGQEFSDVEQAIFASEPGAVVEIIADVAKIEGYAMAVDRNITLKGNGHKIHNQVLIYADDITLTLDGVIFEYDGIMFYNAVEATKFTLTAKAGSENTIKQTTNTVGFFIGNDDATFTLNGTGDLLIDAPIPFYGVNNLVIDNPNLTLKAYNATYMLYTVTTPVLHAGKYQFDPSNYVLAPYYVSKSNSLYQVSSIGDNKAVCNYIAYASLQEAVDAASAGATIVMYADDNSSVEVGKNLIIDTKGHSINGAVAASGYAKAIMGDKVAFTDNAIAAFLMADGTNSMTIDANDDISNAGTIHVRGNKTLTINEGVTVTYKRQGSLANIVVDEGAKLTVLGSGTFLPVMHSETRTIDGFTAEISATSSNQIGNRAIDVDGELIVGVKDDANNCPHFITSSIARGSAVMVNATGVATFNNADMKVASMSIKNYGNVTINGGEYKSIATYQNGINGGWYAYHLNNEGVMTVNDGHFVGVQGAFSNTTANAIVTINGGSFETVNGHNWATGEANAKDNHYALYVACYSVVNVYGGYYKVTTPSAGGGKVVLVGNNDAYNTYGIVNLYGGHFQRKVEVSPRKNAESSYPASIPSTSQWYGSFGSLAPLPAGYEYYETGDATYPYGVKAIAGKETAEIESTETTIPWQQSTTWAEGEVPENNTIVTIPVGKTVVVSKDETEKEAVADQIFINQGASLTVQEGTALTVGDGGVNIAYGGSVTVEPGAVVKIGASGVITAEEDALVLESTEDAQAILLYDPNVAENTQPKAMVKLTTKSNMLEGDPAWKYTYQRFAIPVKEAMVPANDFNAAVHEFFPGEESYDFESYVYYWTGHNWANTSWNALVPFKGYQLANNSKNGGVTYTFTGNLFGNEDKAFEFQESGFDYFGNSYTAPINVQTFLNGFGADVEATIWLYNYSTKNWETIALEDITDGIADDEFKQIKSMDGFLLNLRAASGSAPVDYESAIWGNPLLPAHAPARNMAANELNNSAVITVKDNAGFGDKLTLVEKDNYTNAFENGADASKYILPEGVSLYAETLEGKLGRVATNDLNNTIISFRSGDNAEYTLTFGKVNGEDYLLRDNATGMTMAIAEGSTYTFTQEANTTVPARFEIIGIAKTPTAIENVGAEAKAHGIYSIAGQFLGNDFTVLPAGVYVVNGVKVVK